MIDTLRRFWALSPSSRAVALEATAALVATRVGLRLAGILRWKRVLDRFTPPAADRVTAERTIASALLDSVRETARVERAVARHLFFRSNCLEQSLVLWWLLRRQGISAEVRVGVRKNDGQFEAHAWVEFGGAVLNHSPEMNDHFTPFEGSLTALETQIR